MAGRDQQAAWRVGVMLENVLEVLTGLGLSASAGLNAYIPLLAIGLLSRFTGLMELPPSWHWLSNGWVLLILFVLLAIEVVADKVPVMDSANDVLHTIIRPTAGGLAFGAASESQTVTVSNPGTFFSSHQWIPIATGVIVALCVHGTKATARPVVNATTLGVGAPIVSTIEDVFSTVVSVVAIVLPILVLVFLIAFVWFFVWARRRRKRRKAEKLALRAENEALKAALRAQAVGGMAPTLPLPVRRPSGR